MDVRTLVQVMYDGGIAASGTDHRMANPMSHQQGCQYIDVLFVTIHYYIY